jgi:hypothetical protein
MKKILFAVPICFLLNACTKTETTTITETIDLKRGLIAYYPFNGNANDTSGNNKHGVLVNGTGFSTDAKNKENSAANFDGVDDYIRIADQTSYFAPLSNKMSVSFLVNLRDVNTRSAFIIKSGFDAPGSVCWASGVSLDNQNFIDFNIASPTDCSVLWVNNPYSNVKSNNFLQNNKWFHITLIHNLGVEMIYVNGVLNSATVSNITNLKRCSNADLKIGGWWTNDIMSIEGKIDEVRIYDRILAENEIEKLASEAN